MNTDELATYEQMTVMTPSDELDDAVEPFKAALVNLLAEVKRLRELLGDIKEAIEEQERCR